METLHKICGVGLLESFNKRLLIRGNKTVVRWQLDSYLGHTRAVSHKVAQYRPFADLNRRQVVFRIHSRQRVTRMRRSDGTVLEETVRDVVEYLVLEKRRVQGVESSWFVWGTTTESRATCE